MTVTETQAEWIIDWRGNTWDSTMLTGHHAAAVAEMLGFAPGWEWFDVSDLHPLYGPLPLMAVIAAFSCVEGDVRGAAARAAVLDAIKDTTLDELAGAVRLPS